MGDQANPYPYMGAADIYVQRHIMRRIQLPYVRQGR